jgi:hypothetical protein
MKYRTGAIDSTKRLAAFFEAKGHRNLVLRVVDVLDLRFDHQDLIIGLAAESYAASPREEQQSRKQWMQRLAPDGYLVLPLAPLLRGIDMEIASRLQEAIYAYTQVRRYKGEPSRTDDCEPCKGTGRVSGAKCGDCGGEGAVITFIEVSPEERVLAERERA